MFYSLQPTLLEALPPSCLAVTVTSSVLEYEYLAWGTF